MFEVKYVIECTEKYIRFKISVGQGIIYSCLQIYAKISKLLIHFILTKNKCEGFESLSKAGFMFKA